MAYSTYHAPAHVGTTLRNAATSVGHGISAFLATLGQVVEINSTAHIRLARVERLQAKTDAELATLGIKRDQIVHHVFKDLFYS